MMVAARNIGEVLLCTRLRARARHLRPVVWALVWASLAHLSWSAFKGAQVRLQPDAIATGLPGFVFRLFIRPLQWAADSFQWGEPGLQMAVAMAICAATIGLSWHISGALGGGRSFAGPILARTLPGRRETTWN